MRGEQKAKRHTQGHQSFDPPFVVLRIVPCDIWLFLGSGSKDDAMVRCRPFVSWEARGVGRRRRDEKATPVFCWKGVVGESKTIITVK